MIYLDGIEQKNIKKSGIKFLIISCKEGKNIKGDLIRHKKFSKTGGSQRNGSYIWRKNVFGGAFLKHMNAEV